jgi:signal peptidase II
VAFFGSLAAAIVVTDQLVKQWVLASFEPNRIYPVLGDWIRIDFIHNAGGLFGMMQGAAPILAAITVGVVAVIVLMEVRWGWQSWPMTLALGLLLGGAIGNFIDRIRFGYVIDFADIGAGTWRWYIFNVADSAVTGFFLLIIVMWLLVPRAIPTGEAGSEETAQTRAKEPAGR